MRKKTSGILLAAIILIAIQFVPVDRSNPRVSDGLVAPPAVSEAIRVSCYDCHSNETRWPWYSYVAPASWVMAHHVHEGRDHLNFSTWSELTDGERTAMMQRIWRMASKGKMPLRSYLLLHREAKLTDQQLEAIHAWSQTPEETGVQETGVQD